PTRAASEVASRMTMNRDMTLLPGAPPFSTLARSRPLNSVTQGAAASHIKRNPSQKAGKPRGRSSSPGAPGSLQPPARLHVVSTLAMRGDVQALTLVLLGHPDTHHELQQVEADRSDHRRPHDHQRDGLGLYQQLRPNAGIPRCTGRPVDDLPGTAQRRVVENPRHERTEGAAERVDAEYIERVIGPQHLLQARDAPEADNPHAEANYEGAWNANVAC